MTLGGDLVGGSGINLVTFENLYAEDGNFDLHGPDGASNDFAFRILNNYDTAVGNEVEIDFQMDTSVGTSRVVGRIGNVWTDTTDGSSDTDMRLSHRTNGALVERLRLDGSVGHVVVYGGLDVSGDHISVDTGYDVYLDGMGGNDYIDSPQDDEIRFITAGVKRFVMSSSGFEMDENSVIFTDVSDEWLGMGGGQTYNDGAGFLVYGASHSNLGDFLLYGGGDLRLMYDASQTRWEVRSGTYMVFEGNENIVTSGGFQFDDAIELQFGSGSDARMEWTGTYMWHRIYDHGGNYSWIAEDSGGTARTLLELFPDAGARIYPVNNKPVQVWGDGADGQYLELISDNDVTAGTYLTHDDGTFVMMKKNSATAGGGLIYGQSDGGDVGLTIWGHVIGGAGDTTKTTAAEGVVEFYACDGSTADSCSDFNANANLFTWNEVGEARMILDEDGDLYVDGPASQPILYAEGVPVAGRAPLSDGAALAALEHTIDPTVSWLADWYPLTADEAAAALEAEELVGPVDPDTGRRMVNIRRVTMLAAGAAGANYREIASMRREMASLRAQVVSLTARIEAQKESRVRLANNNGGQQ